jgi:hypothetical protein
MLCFPTRLLINGAFGVWDRLQPRIRDLLTALHRKAVRSLLEPLLGPLDRAELRLEPVDHRTVALEVEELRSGVRRMLIDRGELLGLPPRTEVLELPQGSLALASKKLAYSIRIHVNVSSGR